MTRYYRHPFRSRRRVTPGQKAAAAAGAVVVLFGAGHVAHHHGSIPAGSAAPGASSSGANERLGMRMAADAGWTGSQGSCLNWLWTRESGWRMVWNYQGSGAYGIAQALPPSKMASAGADYMTSPRTQIRWGLGYIAGRYQTPCGAWAHETSFGWY